jgi:stage III sporulation protein AE
MILFLALAALTVSAQAAAVPDELQEALPQAAEELLDGESETGTDLNGGIRSILSGISKRIEKVLRERLRGAALILLAVLLCSAADGFYQGVDSKPVRNLTPMAGALSITLLTAGSLDSLIGLGAGAIEEMHTFSGVLLPTLAAVTAAGGAVGTAAAQQVATVFFIDLLLSLINGLLIPAVYLYIGALTASAMLSDERLGSIASALKKTSTWLLSASMIAFTVYLSVVRVISGTADSAAVKVTKAAIAGAVPVVGSILSEASETVLAGAGMLKGTIGVFGMLAVLAVCAYPFLQLGVQYLVYKLTAFLAGIIGTPELCRLIDGLGGAFGLVLGMTGACALLLLISILSSVAAVTP